MSFRRTIRALSGDGYRAGRFARAFAPKTTLPTNAQSTSANSESCVIEDYGQHRNRTKPVNFPAVLNQLFSPPGIPFVARSPFLLPANHAAPSTNIVNIPSTE